MRFLQFFYNKFCVQVHIQINGVNKVEVDDDDLLIEYWKQQQDLVILNIVPLDYHTNDEQFHGLQNATFNAAGDVHYFT